MSKKTGKQDTMGMSAEQQLVRHAPAELPSARSAGELLHELQLQQIELEMQNEALRESQIALEKSRDRYLDLYEFAPIGYLTLTRDALIAEINLTGAALLGEDRNKLINRRFTAFVAPVGSRPLASNLHAHAATRRKAGLRTGAHARRRLPLECTAGQHSPVQGR